MFKSASEWVLYYSLNRNIIVRFPIFSAILFWILKYCEVPGLEGFGRYPVFTAVFTGKYRPGKNRFWIPKVGKTGKNTT